VSEETRGKGGGTYVSKAGTEAIWYQSEPLSQGRAKLKGGSTGDRSSQTGRESSRAERTCIFLRDILPSMIREEAQQTSWVETP